MGLRFTKCSPASYHSPRLTPWSITQEALKQLACLGNVGEIGTLALVYGETEEAMHAALWEAVHAGLVYREDSSYKFLHDRVQEAAYALIPKELRARLHLRIGRSLIAKMNQGEIEDKIFDIVNQLNSGRSLISDLHEKDLVARLNLRAGTKAKASAAYDSACIYLVSGMELLGQRRMGRQVRPCVPLMVRASRVRTTTAH